ARSRPQLFDAAHKSRAAGGGPMVQVFTRFAAKSKRWSGLSQSLVRSTDVGVLDDLRPLGDFGFDIAIERIGRAGADRHSEIGEALLDLRLADEPRHLRVQPQDDVARRA